MRLELRLLGGGLGAGRERMRVTLRGLLLSEGDIYNLTLLNMLIIFGELKEFRHRWRKWLGGVVV